MLYFSYNYFYNIHYYTLHISSFIQRYFRYTVATKNVVTYVPPGKTWHLYMYMYSTCYPQIYEPKYSNDAELPAKYMYFLRLLNMNRLYMYCTCTLYMYMYYML